MATTASRSAEIATGNVHDRRRLAFQSIDDIQAEAERLLAGGYTPRGNWSLGQMCRHLAGGLKMRLEPSALKVPAPVRWVAQTFLKPRALKRMKPGFKLPSAAKSLLPEPTADAQGVALLRETIARWHREEQLHPHPFFGKMTREEWDRLMLRHAEMHLSFLEPRST